MSTLMHIYSRKCAMFCAGYIVSYSAVKLRLVSQVMNCIEFNFISVVCMCGHAVCAVLPTPRFSCGIGLIIDIYRGNNLAVAIVGVSF